MQAHLPIKVHAVKQPRPGLFFAHVQLSELWSDVICEPEVLPGDARLRISFKTHNGRLLSALKVVV